MPSQRIDTTPREAAHLNELTIRLDQARKTVAAIHGATQYLSIVFAADSTSFTVNTPDSPKIDTTKSETAHLNDLAIRFDQARKTVAASHGATQYLSIMFAPDNTSFIVNTPDGTGMIPTQAQPRRLEVVAPPAEEAKTEEPTERPEPA